MRPSTAPVLCDSRGPHTEADWQHAHRLVHAHGWDTLAYFALRDDKSFFFGSDGGGEGFAFDLRTHQLTIVEVPFIGMSAADANVVVSNFHQFLAAIAK